MHVYFSSVHPKGLHTEMPLWQYYTPRTQILGPNATPHLKGTGFFGETTDSSCRGVKLQSEPGTQALKQWSAQKMMGTPQKFVEGI